MLLFTERKNPTLKIIIGIKKIFFRNTFSFKNSLPVLEIEIVINEKMINRSLIVKLLNNLKKGKGNKKNAEKRKNLDNEMIIRYSLNFLF
jgi:hypothetical protein|tara:strand:- start:1392 stop:1661 length:270 start_codon:yes stop_codon:yes gene_type:complete